MKFFKAAWVAALLFNIAVVSGLVYVAAHFLAKVW